MRQSHKFLEAIDMSLYRRYLQQLLVIFTTLVFSSYTIAAVTCDAGFITDNFDSRDYTSLAPIALTPNPKSNQTIVGTGNESYLIASNVLTTDGTLSSGGVNVYQSTAIPATTSTEAAQVFRFYQDFANKTTTRTVSYTFKNKFTNQSQALNKLSLSVFDIDTNYAGFTTSGSVNTDYFEFFDQVTITGFTSANSTTPITPTIQSKGSGISNSAPYRQTNTTSSVSCGGLDNNCKVSVAFSQPVIRVDITYGNNTNLNYYDQSDDNGDGVRFNDPGDQLVDIRFDGYCYQPQPRLTYSKALSTSRKKNTDQFTVQIKDNADNSVVTSGITTTTTTGTGNTITNGTGTTGTFKVDPTKTYTLTESAASENTNLIDYTASYTCKRSNGTTVTTLDPNNLQMTYGDNWNCTVNNSPNYVFSGIVFNDNGGILENNSANLDTNTKYDISSRFTGNTNYFNGVFDSSSEVGIETTAGLSVSLTDCKGNNISTVAPNSNPQTQLNSPLGQFKFTVSASAIANLTTKEVCLEQVEPDPWTFSVDTTPNLRKISLVAGKFDYKTDGSRNLDFGEVKANYASLVLIKSQHVNDCDINANYDGIFSTSEIDGIEPGRCIAYKIDAYNRGHVDIRDVEITDELKQTPVKSVFHLPYPKGSSSSVYDNTGSLPMGTIVSKIFNLDKPTGTSATRATLYFNTKYGTTVDP